MKFLKKISLYFLPGVVPTVILLLIHQYSGEKLPSMTILIVLDFLVTIPLMIYIITSSSHSDKLNPVKEIFRKQTKTDVRLASGLILFALCWAIVTFILLRPVNGYLLHHVFDWIPDWFIPGLFTDQFPSSILKTTWVMMIPFSILMPLMEEIYFRGFLLPREKFDDWRAPVINTLLFCAYHFWSPHLILTRAIAIFPMNYIVWRYKNIYLSIVPHILLNVVGDVILTYPLIFQ